MSCQCFCFQLFVSSDVRREERNSHDNFTDINKRILNYNFIIFFLFDFIPVGSHSMVLFGSAAPLRACTHSFSNIILILCWCLALHNLHKTSESSRELFAWKTTKNFRIFSTNSDFFVEGFFSTIRSRHFVQEKNIPQRFLAWVGELSRLLIFMLANVFSLITLHSFWSGLQQLQQASASALFGVSIHERKSRASVKVEEGKVEGGQTASKSGTFARLCIFSSFSHSFIVHITEFLLLFHLNFCRARFKCLLLKQNFFWVLSKRSKKYKETGEKPTPLQLVDSGRIGAAGKNTTFKFIYNQNDI